MSKNNSRPQRSNHVPTQFELFTGGKTPAFALFYNLAYFRVAGMVCFSLGHAFIEDKEQEQAIQTTFEAWLEKPIDPTGKIFPKLRDSENFGKLLKISKTIENDLVLHRRAMVFSPCTTIK